MLEFLPPRVIGCLRYVNCNLLYELRLRAEKPLSAYLDDGFVFLGEHGICGIKAALRPTTEEIQGALLAACDYSLYAAENQLRQGFVTTPFGERLGIAGSYVYENGSVHAIRDVTSLCIRIPHEIRGCAEQIYRRCFSDGVRSLLILAPPGEGKTTVLRDLCRLIGERTYANILVSDERGELSAGELGETSDVIRFADKQTAFTAGIRAMRPAVIVTDELLPRDYEAVRQAIESGIAVLASAHLTAFESVPHKLFSRYVLLSGIGNVEKIVDETGEICG